MKNFKIFLLAAVALVAGAFVSCSDDDNFTAGPAAEGPQVYFPSGTTTEFSLSDDVNSIVVPLRRVDTNGAVTVALLADDPSGLFTIPASASFAEGQDKVDLNITFDRRSLVDGTEYPLQIMINDESVTTPYGDRTIALSVTPWPWEEMGTGRFREDWLSNFFNGPNVEVEVPVHRHKSRPGVYMFENMFGWDFMTEFFKKTQSQLSGQFSYTPTNFIIDCSNPDAVTFADQLSGIQENNYGYGQFAIALNDGVTGTLVGGVITFPTKGVLFGAVNGTDAQGWYYANTKGLFRLMLPGAEVVDYTLSALYDGMRVGSDNATAKAVINFTCGADVTGIGYTIFNGDVTAQAGEAVALMLQGQFPIREVEGFTAGTETFSLETELVTGVYTIVALPKNKQGDYVADEAAAISFYFPGLGGSDAPECELELLLGATSQYWPEMIAKGHNDTNSLFFQIVGSELKSLKSGLWASATIDAVLAGGGTLEEIVDEYGSAEDEWMAYINENGFYGSLFIKLAPDASYTWIVKATNIYGKSAVQSATYATVAGAAAAPAAMRPGTMWQCAGALGSFRSSEVLCALDAEATLCDPLPRPDGARKALNATDENLTCKK